MKWQDRISNIIFEITTGDGKKYSPRLGTSEMRLLFNVNILNYNGFDGSKLDRAKAQGEKYPLDFYFVGDDHNTEFINFIKSAKASSRPWILKHPHFDEIKAQPLEIVGRPYFGSTYVTGQIGITLDDTEPLRTELDKQAGILEKHEANNALVIAEYKGTSASDALSVTDIFATNYENLPNSQEDITRLKNIVTDVKRKAVNILDAPSDFSQSLQALVNFPNEIALDVKSAYQSMLIAFDDILNIAGIDSNIFETSSNFWFNSASELLFNFEFKNKKEAVESQNKYSSTFDKYNSSVEDSGFEPEPDIYFNLYTIVTGTLAELIIIAQQAKTEISINAPKKQNSILYTAQYYGADLDNELLQFIEDNEIGLDEMLEIQQGKELTFFV